MAGGVSTWAAVIAQAREALATGRALNHDALAAQVRATASPEELDRALAQLDRVVAVGRAKARLTREPAAPAPRPSLRTALKTRPLLTANMNVRRVTGEDGPTLAWDAAPAVVAWDVRVAERADARSDYVSMSEATLAAETTMLTLPLSDRALRIHVLGRGRDGRLLRRAVITGLSIDNWDERWQKRPSAS